ncbi:MAG: class I SAM-dependent methyltransferase [Planctomycetes bacterium]|nr:class I SAM-dependent methyltransferase [Planctomycetota bacterium]
MIQLWDGTGVGDPSGVGKIILQQPGTLRRLCWNPSLAFGECYTDGTLLVDGDLRTVLVEVNRGLARARAAEVHQPRTTRFTRSSHSLTKSKSSVHHHYDLGNDFYRLWLDERMVYTCAYYPRPDANLNEAQVAKLDYVCRKLRLQPGERVVEAGCGWGALAIHMAKNYGVQVQACNLSTEQIQHARQWAETEGLTDRIQFVEDDYRHMSGQFDAFVSVGMLEHVGPENYRDLGRLMSRVLTPTGRGLIHSIGRNATRPLDPWTDKYIFPGAHPPSLREMMDLFEGSGFSVLDVENLRMHYARTCADWLARFELVAHQIREMFDERFVRMWRLYLAASSATFETGDLQLFQVVFARDSNNTMPWTRVDWYANSAACPSA